MLSATEDALKLEQQQLQQLSSKNDQACPRTAVRPTHSFRETVSVVFKPAAEQPSRFLATALCALRIIKGSQKENTGGGI
jgi:hypothetical protein